MRQNVNLILVNNRGFVLCQHRDNIPTILGPDTWCAPGGIQEKSDISPQAAAVRELFEETGYKANPDELQLIAEEDYVTDKGVPIHRTVFWTRYDDKQKIECYEGQEFRFIGIKELDSLKLYVGHDKFLRQASKEYLKKFGEI
jgi:8-oxo-dGTP pyrophosphatase MutT (NUDIX family)